MSFPGVHRDEPARGVVRLSPITKPQKTAKNDPVFTAEQLSDQRWRMNNLYFIVNKQGQRVRFRMNSVQRRMFDEMHYRNVVPKSRQHGVTTFWCIYALDTALFNSNWRGIIVGHDIEDVKVIFRDKIKFPYDNLPEWVKEARSAVTDRKEEMLFNNNSSVRVTDSGRSGTNNFCHVSEMGKIAARRPDKAAEIVSGTFETSASGQMITVEATAMGQHGQFHDICKEAKAAEDEHRILGPLDFKLFFFPWHEDPNNILVEPVTITQEMAQYFEDVEAKIDKELTTEQKAWYVKKQATLKDMMKREHPSTYEECWESSIEGAYYAKEFTFLRKNKRICGVPPQTGLLTHSTWDLGYDDTMAIWLVQIAGREVHWIDYYQNSHEGLPHYKNWLDHKSRERGLIYGQHIAPHDIEVHELTSGRTRKDIARDLGINFTAAPQLEIVDGIEAMRQLMSISFFDAVHCDEGLKALENYQKEWDERRSVWKDSPLHNWASHASDAARYFATVPLTKKLGSIAELQHRKDVAGRPRPRPNMKAFG